MCRMDDPASRWHDRLFGRGIAAGPNATATDSASSADGIVNSVTSAVSAEASVTTDPSNEPAKA